MKKIIGWVILAVMIGGGIYYFTKPKKNENKYVTSEAKIENIKETVSVTGEIKPVNETVLSFESGGTIKNIFADVGDRVEKGQVVATLDTSLLQSQVNKALIALNIQEENLKLKRRKWEDYKPEEKQAFKLAVEEARADVRNIQAQIAKCKLVSPTDGIVIEKNFDKDEVAGATVPILTIMTGNDIELVADVSETDIAKVKIGQIARATFDAFPSDKIFLAKVTKIDPSATVIQDVVYYKVTFDISENKNNPKLKDLFEKLKVGMSSDLDILIAERENVLTVPTQAVKEENGRKYVQVLKGEGEKETVRNVTVETGLYGDEGLVEIISGIKEGERVVTFVNEK